MDCAAIQFTRHAVLRMVERDLSLEETLAAIRLGDVIETDPSDTPYPTTLLLGRRDGRVLHVLVSHNPQTGICYVVTVYRPDPATWSGDFKRRLKR